MQNKDKPQITKLGLGLGLVGRCRMVGFRSSWRWNSNMITWPERNPFMSLIEYVKPELDPGIKRFFHPNSEVPDLIQFGLGQVSYRLPANILMTFFVVCSSLQHVPWTLSPWTTQSSQASAKHPSIQLHYAAKPSRNLHVHMLICWTMLPMTVPLPCSVISTSMVSTHQVYLPASAGVQMEALTALHLHLHLHLHHPPSQNEMPI